MQHQNNSSGNVLFLILIAVALFAALSYAVTTSTRSGGGNSDNEKTGMIADQILQYAASVKTTHDRMKIAGGFDQVRFSVLSGSEASLVYAGQNSTAGKAGGIFDPLPGGGGLSKRKIPPSWLSPAWDDNVQYFNAEITVGSNSLGTSNPDELLLVKYITQSICEALNLKLTGNKNIPVVTNPSGSSGQASQFVKNDGSIPAMTTNGASGTGLSDLPICGFVGSSYYVFYYPLAEH